MKTSLARIAVGCSALLPLICPSTMTADVLGTITDLNAANAPLTYAGNSVDNVFVPATGGQVLTPEQPPVQNLGSFGITINAGPALMANPAALAAFNRAANQWMALISDPITVTINADLAPLGSGILGSTSSSVFSGGYDLIRNAMVTDAGAGEGILASLPTAAQFTATVPVGATLPGTLLATKANLKALGFVGLPAGPDGSITFSSTFPFDFDNSNGVGAGTYDFETVAAHEIGHALGFISFVDSVVGGATSITPFTLDLFRFQNGSTNDPSNAANFTTSARSLTAGGDAITDDTSSEWRMSTGLSGGGDGSQASHWKEKQLTGILIGLMNPSLASGTAYGITEADRRAMGLIGYDIAVPEPTSLSLLLLGGVAAAVVRRRQV